MQSESTNHVTNLVVLDQDDSFRLSSVAGEDDDAFNIDSWIRPMQDFWLTLQTECVAECCGIQAFDFSPNSIGHASRQFNDELPDQLVALATSISDQPQEVLVSDILNQYLNRDDMQRILTHLIANLDYTSIAENSRSLINESLRWTGVILGTATAAVLWFRPQWSLYALIAMSMWAAFAIVYIVYTLGSDSAED